MLPNPTHGVAVSSQDAPAAIYVIYNRTFKIPPVSYQQQPLHLPNNFNNAGQKPPCIPPPTLLPPPLSHEAA